MVLNINLDENSINELAELARALNTSKSNLIRKAIKDLYLKEKRAKENLLFFVDLYNDGVITKDMLFLLLRREDAESIIIGSKTGKEAVEIAKNISD
jgi:hypothetical protein